MVNPEVIGTMAGALTCITFLPQLLRTYKSKSSEGVSIPTFLIMILGTSLWLTYGIMLGKFSLIFTNAFVLIVAILILTLLVKYRNQ
jgi:MtN3 and saliva related transmembrane protein